MPRTLLFYLVVLLSTTLAAHQDRYYSHTVGNVTLTILTGWEFEEITKCRLVAEQAADFCEILGYKKKITVDFNHEYVSAYAPPAIFISVGKRKIIDQYDGNPFELKHSKKGEVFVRIIADQIPVKLVLQAIRFAANHEKEIIECQEQYRVEREYTEWTLYSMEPRELMSRLHNVNLDDSLERLNNRYYATNKLKGGDASYFLQRDSFAIVYQLNDWTQDILLKSTRLYHIYQSSEDFDFILFFDSRLSFRGIDSSGDPIDVSQRMILPDGYTFSQPYEIIFTGHKRAIIPMYMKQEVQPGQKPPQDVLYSHQDKKIIINLESKLQELLDAER